jgi:hypothetical protein
MSEEISKKLADLNRDFFNNHIDEVIWSKENSMLTVKMDTKEMVDLKPTGKREQFIFVGDEAKQIFKKLM